MSEISKGVVSKDKHAAWKDNRLSTSRCHDSLHLNRLTLVIAKWQEAKVWQQGAVEAVSNSFHSNKKWRQWLHSWN
jgi:hypothetical protein